MEQWRLDSSGISKHDSQEQELFLYQHMRTQNGKIFYLDVPLNEIKKRLSNISTRGVAANKNDSVENIFAEREALYKNYADEIIDLTDCTVEQAVEKISKKIK